MKPSKEVLLEYLEQEIPYSTIAKLHGVKSGNAVKKWYKSYDIELPKRRKYFGHNEYRKKDKKCLNCDNIVKKYHQNKTKYCSNACQQEYQYKRYIERWKAGEEDGNIANGIDISKYVRKYLFEKYDNKCCKCGWCEVNEHTGNIPLQVNHIDGDCTNTTEENLELICPNCHSLTETWGSPNAKKNKGRRIIKQENYS